MSPPEPLAKAVMAPYWCRRGAAEFTARRYTITGGTAAGPASYCFGYALCLLVLAGMLLPIGLWDLNRLIIHWVPALSGFAALAVAAYLYRRGVRARCPERLYWSFDRAEGTVTFPQRKRFKARPSVPWSQCEAVLRPWRVAKNMVDWELWLVTPWEGGRKAALVESQPKKDRLLGHWSFLVQFMDRDGPLPDVLPLKAYPNRVPAREAMAGQKTRLERHTS